MATVNEEIIIGVGVDTKDATKSLKGIEDRIDELTKERHELEIGTADFDRISSEIQQLESELKNVDLQFEALDFEQKFTAGTDAVVGLTGGFMAAQGIMSMVGTESESLEKAFTRMSQALTITMGLRDLANGVVALRKFGLAQKAAAVATRVFNAALKANPIGAIVTAILSLIAVITILIDIFSRMGDTAESSGAKQLKAMKDVEDQLEKNIALAKAYGEVEKANAEAFTIAANARIRAAKIQGKSEKEILDIRKDIADENAKSLRQDFNIASAEAQLIKKRIERMETEQEFRINSGHVIRNSQWTIHQEAVANFDEQQKLLDEEKVNLQKAIANEKRLRAQSVDAFKESRFLQAEFDAQKDKERSARKKKNNEKEVQDNSKSLQAQQNDLNAFYQAVEKIETDHFNSFKTDQEKEEQAVKDKFFQLIELAKRYGEDTAMLEEARQRELQLIRRKFTAQELMEEGEKALEIQRMLEEARIQNITDETERAKAERQQEFDNETLDLLEQGMLTHELELEMKKKLDSDLAELDKKAKEEQKQRTVEAINAGMMAAQNSINALSALNDARLQRELAGLEEGDAKREQIEKQAFERGKKIQIAQAIISGLQGIVNIWSAMSTIPQPYDAILRGINTAALIATTAAQISKIKSTPFAGGGSVSSGGGGGAGAGAVPINNISNTAALVDQQQQEITAQVVVLESDITSTQENVTTVSELSSF